MINLNKKKVTKEGLFNYIKDTDIYRFYTGKNVVLGRPMVSPLGKDNSPSFGYFIGNSGEVCFNDFRLGGGDCIKFVQKLFNLDFFSALSKIVVDFSLTNHFEYKNVPKNMSIKGTELKINREEIIKAEKSKSLKVRRRKWKVHDIGFWTAFGITKATLDKYNVFPIDYIFFGDRSPMVADKYAYVYYEKKDGEVTLKIYQPFSKNYKWLNSHNSTIWQGWSQLPEKGDVLIITKSLKDVMSITSVLKISSVALQSESTLPKQSVMAELQQRFNTIYLLWDNDFDKEINTGRILGAKIAEDFPVIQIEIPSIYKSKDFSDLIKNHGNKQNTINIFKECCKVPF